MLQKLSSIKTTIKLRSFYNRILFAICCFERWSGNVVMEWNGMEWNGRREYISVIIVCISYTFFSSFQLKTRLSIWHEKRKTYPFHCYFDTQHKCTNIRLNNYRDSFSSHYAIFLFFAIINFVVNKHRSVFLPSSNSYFLFVSILVIWTSDS